MGAWRSLGLLAALAAPAAGAASAGKLPELEVLRAEIDHELALLRPRLKRLEEGLLERELGKGGERSPGEAERLGRELRAGAQRVDALLLALHLRERAIEIDRAGRGLSRRGDPGLPVDFVNAILDVRGVNEFQRRARSFRGRLSLALSREATIRLREEEAAASLARWRLAAAAWSAVLAAAAFFPARRRLTRAPAAGEPPPPAAPDARADAEEAPLSPGVIVGGGLYRIRRHLGGGLLGAAYEAVEIGSGRPVALKRFRRELHTCEKDVERLLAAARRVGELRHPNIVEIRSVFLEGERVFLDCELLRGEPLDAALAQGSKLALGALRAVMGPVLAALEHAHSRGVVHGDLRPPNILLGPAGAVKVKDFGLALLAEEIGAQKGAPGLRANPAYSAPELEMGEPCAASDLYSVGVILYEAATGRLPFEGPSFLAQKRQSRMTPASRIEKGLPPAFDALLAALLAPELGRRPRDAAAVARELAGAALAR